MKFEFHAHLSHLGFDGVYPIYWIKESKHAKHEMNSRRHKDVPKQICCPNYIKEANHKRFVQQSSIIELSRKYLA
jgi:hypothetical protein